MCAHDTDHFGTHLSAIMDRCESLCDAGGFYSSQRSWIVLSPPVVPNALIDMGPTSSMHIPSEVEHLRKLVKKWMMLHGSTEVWAGMAFKDLAMSMSSHRESYSDHISRMATIGEWVDASVIHALAATFRVDCLIFQSKMSPAIVGHSIMAGETSEPLACINLAMANDLHFWGVRPIHMPLMIDPDPSDWMRPDRLLSSHLQ